MIWSDIDLYHAYRDFTTDPVRYPTEDMRDFISDLVRVLVPSDRALIDVQSLQSANEQRYVPIVDAAIPVVTNGTDTVCV